jgi:hypothetical protein
VRERERERCGEGEGESEKEKEGGREREREREGERKRELWNLVIEFISLLLTMAALQIKCFFNSLTRNKFFNCPE